MGQTLQHSSADYGCIQCTSPAWSDPRWVFHPQMTGVVGRVLRLEEDPEQVSRWLALPAVGGWQKGQARQCLGTRVKIAGGYGISGGVESADGDDAYAPCPS